MGQIFSSVYAWIEKQPLLFFLVDSSASLRWIFLNSTSSQNYCVLWKEEYGNLTYLFGNKF